MNIKLNGSMAVNVPHLQNIHHSERTGTNNKWLEKYEKTQGTKLEIEMCLQELRTQAKTDNSQSLNFAIQFLEHQLELKESELARIPKL